MPSAIVIGGGLSGLSAAFYLLRKGDAVTLVEPETRLGGILETRTIDGCLIEAGADSYLAAKTALRELVATLGLEADIIGSNDHQRRTYILRDGRLMAMPEALALMAPADMAALAVSPLISPRGRLRAAQELLRARPGAPLPDRSIAEFVRDHWGDEFVDYLAEPLMTGVFGGDVENLSARQVLPRLVDLETRYGSVSRGLVAEPTPPRAGSMFEALKGGWSQLIGALTSAIASADRVRSAATRLERLPGGWRVHAGHHVLAADRVIVATRSWQAATLFEAMDPELAALLLAVPHSSAATVGLTFGKERFPDLPPGFGFLVPRRERKSILAATFVDRKFNYRAAPDRVVIRAFLGGEEWCAAPDAELLTAVRQDLQRIAGVDSAPIAHCIGRWPRSMPQYAVGHGDWLVRVRARLEHWPGLSLIGNAFDGIGMPDCVRLARSAAEA
jgi:oxygen-dependent protoporphyrinogen oxidase